MVFSLSLLLLSWCLVVVGDGVVVYGVDRYCYGVDVCSAVIYGDDVYVYGVADAVICVGGVGGAGGVVVYVVGVVM